MPRKKTITGKKHKGFYIYSRDLLSSQRYRRCSWATKGVYLDLLNVLAVQDHPGALCLRDYDLKPRGERSLTQRCLACQKKAKNGEYQSIKYFAEAIAVSASGPRPGLIHGLQELYMRGIICIVGDTLLQPRMYRDSGMEVTDFDGQPIDIGEGEYVTVVGSPDDAEADPDAERLRLGDLADNSINKGTENGVQNVPEKGTKKSRVGAGDAPAQSKRVGVRDNNIKDNSGNNIVSSKEKSEKTAVAKKRPVAENPPTLDEICAYFDERAQQGKPFLYITPATFFDACEQSGWRLKDGKPMMDWRARVRTFENYRRDRGDAPIGQHQQRQGEAVPATEPRKGKYNKW